jgi:hypothetical protein
MICLDIAANEPILQSARGLKRVEACLEEVIERPSLCSAILTTGVYQFKHLFHANRLLSLRRRNLENIFYSLPRILRILSGRCPPVLSVLRLRRHSSAEHLILLFFVSVLGQELVVPNPRVSEIGVERNSSLKP